MIISHHGGEFIKITFGDTTIAFNPPSKDSDIKASRFGCDIAFVSINHPDMDGASELGRGEKQPFIISGPGEYEVGGIFSIGIPTKSRYGGDDMINTVYVLQFEGMNIVYAGALGEGKIDTEALEQIDSVDILFVPIGGDGVLDPADAQKLAVSLEARVVIPIHWSGMGEKDSLKTFLKEAGAEDAEKMDKYTIKKKDILTLAGEVIVLTPQ
jgi:L-ascorbate metabolism protein UlaG (beta-lactamase superfamily)